MALIWSESASTLDTFCRSLRPVPKLAVWINGKYLVLGGAVRRHAMRASKKIGFLGNAILSLYLLRVTLIIRLTEYLLHFRVTKTPSGKPTVPILSFSRRDIKLYPYR
jgi:hypothetical protein